MEHEYIKRIFERADIQQIREFLLTGIELDETDKRPYDARLEDGSMHIVNRLKSIYKTEQEFSDAYDDLCEATLAYTEVYLEIGMKTGAKIIFNLLH